MVVADFAFSIFLLLRQNADAFAANWSVAIVASWRRWVIVADLTLAVLNLLGKKADAFVSNRSITIRTSGRRVGTFSIDHDQGGRTLASSVLPFHW